MNPHDSDVGCYLDIQLHYSQCPDAIAYACRVEDNLPQHWDEAAQQEVAALKREWEGIIQEAGSVRPYSETVRLP